MLRRQRLEQRILTALGRSPVVALLGPRQVGKTTIARHLAEQGSDLWESATFFDLESPIDLRKLENPMLTLGALDGLVVVDEIQLRPELLAILRVLVDRPKADTRFLILGSASPDLVRGSSESLAGRVEFVDLAGFDLDEVGTDQLETLWLRGGFPRSFLADSEADSFAWRESFVRTFLERDLPQLGIGLPAFTLRRFWTMLAHYHGQTWNASELGRAFGVSDKTVRGYLDVLTGTFMVRQLPPWFENLGKRQVKAPKIYLRDSGLVHGLLGLETRESLLGHPKVGASWEGFALEQILTRGRHSEAYFWATHSGAELDLLLFEGGKRFGVELKRNEAPRVSRSMRGAFESLRLDHLWVVHPGSETFPLDDRITALPLVDFPVALTA